LGREHADAVARRAGRGPPRRGRALEWTGRGCDRRRPERRGVDRAHHERGGADIEASRRADVSKTRVPAVENWFTTDESAPALLEVGMEMELVLGPLYEDDEHEYVVWQWAPLRSTP